MKTKYLAAFTCIILAVAGCQDLRAGIAVDNYDAFEGSGERGIEIGMFGDLVDLTFYNLALVERTSQNQVVGWYLKGDISSYHKPFEFQNLSIKAGDKIMRLGGRASETNATNDDIGTEYLQSFEIALSQYQIATIAESSFITWRFQGTSLRSPDYTMTETQLEAVRSFQARYIR